MGIGVDNCNLRAHRPAGGSATDYHLHVHHQNHAHPPVDAACPVCPPCAALTPEATQAIEAAKAAIKAATAPPPTVKE